MYPITPSVFKSIAPDAQRPSSKQIWSPAIFSIRPYSMKTPLPLKSFFKDFLEWEKDILMFGEVWDLDAMPRLKAKPELIDKLSDVNPFKLAKDNPYNEYAIASACSKYGLLLSFACPELQNSKDIALKAINERASSVQYVSHRLKQDPDIIRICLTKDGLSLNLFPATIASQLEWAALAVSQNGLALKYVKGDLKKNKELVKVAVSNNGYALQFASEELQNDFEIVEAAINFGGRPKEWVDRCLEPRPASVMSELFLDLRMHNLRFDPLFSQRLEFVNMLNGLQCMPLDFAHHGLKSHPDLIAQSTKRYEELTGLAKERSAKKRCIDTSLKPIAERANIVQVKKDQEFIGPMPGIDLRDFLGKPKGASGGGGAGKMTDD